MRIAFLTGIWPPDVGGPATHGPDFARFLIARGHEVRVVTMGDGEPAERPCQVEVVSRRLPFPLRYGQVALRGARAARSADVVYATATYAAAAAAATAARRPLVAKLVSDPAYERARRYRLFAGTLEEFQVAVARRCGRSRRLGRERFGPRRRSSFRARTLPRSHAGGAFAKLASLVLTNPAPPPIQVEPERLEPGTFVFVGRLTRQKALGVAIEAIARVPAARLVVVGDGPERAELERLAAPPRPLRACGSSGSEPATRRCASSPAPRRACSRATGRTCRTRRSRRCRSACRSSRRPSAASPRSCATARTACSFRAGDSDALAAAVRRILEEPGLRDRLAAAAKPSVEALSSDAVYGKLEALLAEAAR